MAEQEGQSAKKKRATVADLKEQLDGLQTQITHGLNPAYTDLRKDLLEVEKVIGEDILEKLADFEFRIQALEKAAKDKPDSAVTNVTDRLFALENAVGTLADAVKTIGEGIADWGIRMEEAEDSIHSLQAAVADMQESATHTEPVPLPRPIPEQEKHIDPGALKAIAQVAQNMGDVLAITRVLQTAGGLSDDEKRQIISIACQAAGVPYSENLLVRAGVRHFEA